jgi:NAD(P)H-dependent flavin oxidoreductase YrpB (nitropropane dioxygenase family)
MQLLASLADKLELPDVGSPLFNVSGPKLVIAQCKAGIVGSFPALAITAYAAHDIVYSNLFAGVHGNYPGPSIAAAGLDPDNLPVADKSKMNFGSGGNMKVKTWRDIWGSGQGIGQIADAPPVTELVECLKLNSPTRVSSFSSGGAPGFNDNQAAGVDNESVATCLRHCVRIWRDYNRRRCRQ